MPSATALVRYNFLVQITRSEYALLMSACMAPFLAGILLPLPARADMVDCAKTPDAPICAAIKEASTKYGGCEEDPFPFLERRHQGDRSNSFVTPRGVAGNTAKLGIDTSLACRLKKFFEFAESKGCTFVITSAMRPVQKCNPAGGKCAPQGRSCHQYGKAVDIAGNQRCLNWALETLGRKNSTAPFGLHSAYDEDKGKVGGYRHLQCAEHIAANCSPSTPPCRGGMNISPDLSNIPGPSAMPSSGLSGAARNLLGQQEQMCSLPDGKQVPCSSITNRGASQPVSQRDQLPQGQPPLGSENTVAYPPGTCAPQFYCMNSIHYYRASTCVDQVYQKCSAGCSASTNTCASTSTTASLSSFDQISLIAEPTSTPTGSVSDLLFALSLSGEDIATIGSGATSTAPTSGDFYILPTPLSQQTFVSEDLRYSQVSPYSPQDLSTAQRTLAMMKATLLRALEYLRPFGLRTSSSIEDLPGE